MLLQNTINRPFTRATSPAGFAVSLATGSGPALRIEDASPLAVRLPSHRGSREDAQLAIGVVEPVRHNGER